MKSAILIWSLLLPAWLFGQSPSIAIPQSPLPHLKDSVRIDRLNELSLKYFEKSRKDSASFFASLAYNESKLLLYVHGMAQSLSIQGNMKTYFESNFKEAEKLDKQSIALYDQSENKDGLADTYDHLAL
jgi:hypothetical protein